jgi:uncharacterized protein (DUF2336 family)
MVKPSLSNPLDSLVDLACRDGVDIRPTLLRVLTDLYVQKPVHSPEEETQFVELALGLVDAVDPQTRATVAAALAAYPAAPDVVVGRLNTPISPRAAAGGQAGQDDLIDLFFSASPEERRLILVNLEFVSANTARRNFPVAGELLRRLEGAALKSDPGEFSRVLERALGISRELADKITRDRSGETIVVAAKAIGLKTDALKRILLCLNPVIGQSTRQVYKLSSLFDEISPASAEYMLAIWRTSTRRHSIHASVYWNDERSGPRSSTKPTSHRGHAKSEEPRLRYKVTNVRSNP